MGDSRMKIEDIERMKELVEHLKNLDSELKDLTLNGKIELDKSNVSLDELIKDAQQRNNHLLVDRLIGLRNINSKLWAIFVEIGKQIK